MQLSMEYKKKTKKNKNKSYLTTQIVFPLQKQTIS